MSNEPIVDADPGDETDHRPRNAWQLGMTPPRDVRFEMPEAGGGAGGGEGGEGGADTALIDADPVEGAGAAAEPQLGLTRDEVLELSREGSSQAFQEMLAQAELQDAQARERALAEQQRQQQNQLPPWDPFNPDVVAAYNRAQIMETLQPLVEAIGPALEQTEQTRLNEGRGQAIDLLTEHEKEFGVFDHDRAILQAARYQASGMDSEAAVERAAREQAEFERGLEQRGAEAWRTNAQNLADAGLEPAGGLGAAAEVTEPLTRGGQRRDYKSELRGSLGRMGAGPGVGSPAG